jgi:hypothetical protein
VGALYAARPCEALPHARATRPNASGCRHAVETRGAATSVPITASCRSAAAMPERLASRTPAGDTTTPRQLDDASRRSPSATVVRADGWFATAVHHSGFSSVGQSGDAMVVGVVAPLAKGWIAPITPRAERTSQTTRRRSRHRPSAATPETTRAHASRPQARGGEGRGSESRTMRLKVGLRRAASPMTGKPHRSLAVGSRGRGPSTTPTTVSVVQRHAARHGRRRAPRRSLDEDAPASWRSSHVTVRAEGRRRKRSSRATRAWTFAVAEPKADGFSERSRSGRRS